MKKILLLSISLILVGGGCVSGTAVAPLGPTAISEDMIMNLSELYLDRIPDGVLDQTDIQKLDISKNEMTGALPAEIKNLSDLRVLDASDNQFTGIPAEIGQLSKLEILDYSNNELTGLPHELGNLSNLMILDLSGNDISENDLGVIRQSLPPTTEIHL